MSSGQRIPNLPRRTLILGGAFAATAGAAAAVTPRRHEHTLGNARVGDVIPLQIGPWTAAPSSSLIVPEANAAPTDVYDQVLTRSYLSAGQPAIMLLIAYGAAQSGLMKVHRPEVCYTSAGFSILNDQTVNVDVGYGTEITAKSFQAKREDRNEVVLYWTRISNKFPSDLLAQRLITMERGFQGLIPDGVLVRFSTLGIDRQVSQQAMSQFAKDLVGQASAPGKMLLAGLARPTGSG